MLFILPSVFSFPSLFATAPKSQASIGDPEKLLMTSQMVSLPTSGMQVENAREIFKCIFDALGQRSSEKKLYLAEDCFSGKVQLKGLTVHIVSSEESSDDDESQFKNKFGKGSTALILNDLKILGYVSKSEGVKQAVSKNPSMTSIGDRPKEMKIDVSLGAAEQIVNIALIRLLMQITETIDFVKEENRFAQKVKSLEIVAFQGMRKGSSIEKYPRKDVAELHRGWATMFNVLQLYTNDKVVITNQYEIHETTSEIRKFQCILLLCCLVYLHFHFTKFKRIGLLVTIWHFIF